jgi:Xaa-Pro aminopeptidase
VKENWIDQMKDDVVLLHQHQVRFPRFPYEEYKNRVSRARDLMGKYGVDALLLFAPENIFYYTGFKKENFAIEKRWRRGVILPKNGEMIMLTGNEVFFNATVTSWVRDIRAWGGPVELGRPQNFVEGFVQLIKDVDLHHKVLGMEIWNESSAIQVELTYFEFGQLREALAEAKIVDAGNLIWEQRMMKTPFEIKIIEELASITTRGFNAGLKVVREGATERDIIREMFKVMIDEGLDNEPMHNRISLKGPGHYHAEIMGPHDTILKKGDMLEFEGGPCHKGYWSDVHRIASIGEPPVLERKLHDASLQAEQSAIRVIKPGIRVGDIHRAATEELMSIDPRINVNRCKLAGHGLGLHGHEPPYLVPGGKQADIVLREGMYLAVEVGVFDAPEFRAIGGFSKDNLLVTRDGYQLLTKDIPNHLWVR